MANFQIYSNKSPTLVENTGNCTNEWFYADGHVPFIHRLSINGAYQTQTGHYVHYLYGMEVHSKGELRIYNGPQSSKFMGEYSGHEFYDGYLIRIEKFVNYAIHGHMELLLIKYE